jgi:hypothetical protein
VARQLEEVLQERMRATRTGAEEEHLARLEGEPWTDERRALVPLVTIG